MKYGEIDHQKVEKEMKFFLILWKTNCKEVLGSFLIIYKGLIIMQAVLLGEIKSPKSLKNTRMCKMKKNIALFFLKQVWKKVRC